jgi:hypothetical protein
MIDLVRNYTQTPTSNGKRLDHPTAPKGTGPPMGFTVKCFVGLGFLANLLPECLLNSPDTFYCIDMISDRISFSLML